MVLATGSSNALCWLREVLDARPDLWIITADGVDHLEANYRANTRLRLKPAS